MNSVWIKSWKVISLLLLLLALSSLAAAQTTFNGFLILIINV
jgi:hypothetical protein